MTCVTLAPSNRAELAKSLDDDSWIIACLCAAWCDVCRQYRPGFEELALQHPDKCFIWIDVEDEADVVGDFEVDNFPTLLIQRGETVSFYGTVLPDARQAHRLILAQAGKSKEELEAEAQSSKERREWQDSCNLREHLRESLNN